MHSSNNANKMKHFSFAASDVSGLATIIVLTPLDEGLCRSCLGRAPVPREQGFDKPSDWRAVQLREAMASN